MMKTTFLLLLLGMAGCEMDSKPASQPASATTAAPAPAPAPAPAASVPKDGLPRTIDEAVDRLVSGLKPEDRTKLLGQKRDDMIMYHHGWGTSVRNNFGLWQPASPLRDDCARRAGHPDNQIHPDDCSMLILEAVWDRLHRAP